MNTGTRPFALVLGEGDVLVTDQGRPRALAVVPYSSGFATEQNVGQNYTPVDLVYPSNYHIAYFDANTDTGNQSLIGHYDDVTGRMVAADVTWTPPAGNTARGMAYDYTTSKFWVAVGSSDMNTTGQGIYVVSLNGAPTTVYPLGQSSYDPYAVTFDHDGNAWIASHVQVEEMNSSGAVIQTIPFDPGTAQLMAITEGPDDNIYVVDRGRGQIWRITEDTYKVSVVVRASITCDPRDVKPGFNNDLWFTEHGCDSIGHLSLSTGKVDEYAKPGRAVFPERLAPDNEGNVWFTDTTSNKVFEFTP